MSTALLEPVTAADFAAEAARHATAHAVEHVAALSAASLAGAPAIVLDLVHEIDDFMDEEFLNCSLAFEEADEYGDGDWTCLADMAVWQFAGNNCETATEHVLELIVTRIGQDEGTEHGTVELTWDPNVHFANTVTVDGTTWVVDYTARQFDRALPFPYVAALPDWKQVIDAASHAEHGTPLASTLHLH
ncbi:MAG: hypothetical protein ACOH1Y_17905 [Propionicimonas sp.]